MSSKTILEILVIGIIAMIIVIIILPTHHYNPTQHTTSLPNSPVRISPKDGFTNGVTAFKIGDYRFSNDKVTLEFIGKLNHVFTKNGNNFVSISLGNNTKQDFILSTSIYSKFFFVLQRTIDMSPITSNTKENILTPTNIDSTLQKYIGKPMIFSMLNNLRYAPQTPADSMFKETYLTCNQQFTLKLQSANKNPLSCNPMIFQASVYENF